jgi:hypothetical protein
VVDGVVLRRIFPTVGNIRVRRAARFRGEITRRNGLSE